MTPKEKALDLFCTFRYALSHKDAPLGVHKDNIAKQCALLSVSETIKALEDYGESSFELQNMEQDFRYWDAVKEAINNI